MRLSYRSLQRICSPVMIQKCSAATGILTVGMWMGISGAEMFNEVNRAAQISRASEIQIMQAKFWKCTLHFFFLSHHAPYLQLLKISLMRLPLVWTWHGFKKNRTLPAIQAKSLSVEKTLMRNVMMGYSPRKAATLDCVPTGERVNNCNIPGIKCECACV